MLALSKMPSLKRAKKERRARANRTMDIKSSISEDDICYSFCKAIRSRSDDRFFTFVTSSNKVGLLAYPVCVFLEVESDAKARLHRILLTSPN